MTTYTSIEKSYVHDTFDPTGDSDYISTTVLVSTGEETIYFHDNYIYRNDTSEFDWYIAMEEFNKFKESKLPLIQGRYDFESYQLYVKAEEA